MVDFNRKCCQFVKIVKPLAVKCTLLVPAQVNIKQSFCLESLKIRVESSSHVGHLWAPIEVVHCKGDVEYFWHKGPLLVLRNNTFEKIFPVWERQPLGDSG